MKKLLGIVVLGLLLSGNAKAEILEFDCVPMYKSKTISDVVYFIDTESNEFATEYIYKGEKRRDETFFYLNQTGTTITYSYDSNKEYVYQFDYGQNSFIDRQIKPDNGKAQWKCNSRENIKKIEKAEAELMNIKAKDTCKSIGFKVDTEKFVDCVKDIYVKQLDTQKVGQQLDQNNTTKKTKRKIDPSVWDPLVQLHQVHLQCQKELVITQGKKQVGQIKVVNTVVQGILLQLPFHL